MPGIAEVYRRSLDRPEEFWAEAAGQSIGSGAGTGCSTIGSRRFIAGIRARADRADPRLAALEQMALADFVTRGEFDRHLRRMRPVYRRRRDALLEALEAHLPWLEPDGVSAGLHLVTWLPPHVDETAVVDASRRAGVDLDAVGPYRITTGPGGLIFGYATVSERAIAEGVARLARAVGGS